MASVATKRESRGALRTLQLPSTMGCVIPSRKAELFFGDEHAVTQDNRSLIIPMAVCFGHGGPPRGGAKTRRSPVRLLKQACLLPSNRDGGHQTYVVTQRDLPPLAFAPESCQPPV